MDVLKSSVNHSNGRGDRCTSAIYRNCDLLTGLETRHESTERYNIRHDTIPSYFPLPRRWRAKSHWLDGNNIEPLTALCNRPVQQAAPRTRCKRPAELISFFRPLSDRHAFDKRHAQSPPRLCFNCARYQFF